MAVLPVPLAVDDVPIAVLWLPLAVLLLPTARLLLPDAVAFAPPAAELVPVGDGEPVLSALVWNWPLPPWLMVLICCWMPPIAWSVAYNCEPFTASVLVALTRPAATLVIWRSLPGLPTLTTLVGLAPA